MDDFNSQDQTSLFNSLGQLLQYAQGIQALNNNAGVNPQLLQGQQQIDLQRLAAAQQILNSQQDAVSQNYMPDPNSPYAAQLQGLLKAGPQQIAPPTGNNPYAQWGNIAQQNNANQTWMDLVRTAGINAKNDTMILSPQQQLERDLAMQKSKFDGANSILQGMKPTQAVDPALFQALAPMVGKTLEGSQKSRDTLATAQAAMGAAQAQARGAMGAAQIQAQGNIGAAEAKAKGDIQTAMIQFGPNAGTKLTPAMRTELQKVITDFQPVQASLNQVAKQFNPEFFTTAFKAANYLGGKLDTVGLAPAELKAARQEYTAFLDQTEQMFNSYRKAITGAAAPIQELEQIRQSIFNAFKEGPEAGKASLLNLMTEIQMKMYFAQNGIQNGLIKPSDDALPGTEAFATMVDQLYESKKDGELRQKIYDKLQDIYPQLATKAHMDKRKGVNSQAAAPTAPGNQAPTPVAPSSAQIQARNTPNGPVVNINGKDVPLDELNAFAAQRAQGR